MSLKGTSEKSNKIFKALQTAEWESYESKGVMLKLDEKSRLNLVLKLSFEDKKKYRQWLRTPEGQESLFKFKTNMNESSEKPEPKKEELGVKIKDIVSTVPPEIQDIYDLCKNEIVVSNNDLMITQLYSRIYLDCLLYVKGMTHVGIDVVSDIRKSDLKKSEDLKQAEFQYKKITHSHHIIPSVLLRMLNQHIRYEFVDEKLKNSSREVFRTLQNIISSKLTGKTYLSKNYEKIMMNARIIPGGGNIMKEETSIKPQEPKLDIEKLKAELGAVHGDYEKCYNIAKKYNFLFVKFNESFSVGASARCLIVRFSPEFDVFRDYFDNFKNDEAFLKKAKSMMKGRNTIILMYGGFTHALMGQQGMQSLDFYDKKGTHIFRNKTKWKSSKKNAEPEITEQMNKKITEQKIRTMKHSPNKDVIKEYISPELFNEFDIVYLTVDLPKYNLVAGDSGTIVLVHNAGYFEVEFGVQTHTEQVVTVNSFQITKINPNKKINEQKIRAAIQKILKEEDELGGRNSMGYPNELMTLMRSIVDSLNEIRDTIIKIRKDKKPLLHKIIDFIKGRKREDYYQEPSKPKNVTSNPKFQGINILASAFLQADPSSDLTDQYWGIMEKHFNGRIKFTPEELDEDKENAISFYEDLKTFKRRLDGLKILIQNGIETNFDDLEAE